MMCSDYLLVGLGIGLVNNWLVVALGELSVLVTASILCCCCVRWVVFVWDLP